MLHDNTSSFLLVLALGTALPMIIGFFFVRQVPLLAHEARIAAEYAEAPAVDVEASALLQHENSSHTPLLSPVIDDSSPFTNQEHDEIVHAGTALELSPTRSGSPGLSNHQRSRSTGHRPSFGSAVRMLDIPPNISGRQLWMSSDFWLIFSIMSLCEPFGLNATECQLTSSLRFLVSGTGIMCENQAVFVITS